MKTRRMLAVALLSAGLTAYAGEKDTDLAGNWATYPAGTATPDKKTGGIVEQIFKQGTDVATRQIQPGTGMGGRMGPGAPGGVEIDPAGAKVVAKGSSPDGVALTMELKLNKAKLTGSVTEVVSGTKVAIEEGKVDGQKFEFTTYKKVNNVGIATVYKGELVDPTTIKLTRSTKAGKPLDLLPDGTPEVLVFHRGK